MDTLRSSDKIIKIDVLNLKKEDKPFFSQRDSEESFSENISFVYLTVFSKNAIFKIQNTFYLYPKVHNNWMMQ